jgi:alanine-synthesizing transaminase
MTRFAARTEGWSRVPNALTQALERRRAAGLPVLDLTESNPTRCALQYPREEILAALARPEALAYAPDPLGMPAARDAIAADYASRGVAVDPGRLVLTAGTSEGYGFLFKLLADEGGTVLSPAPSYPLFDLLARLHDVRLVPYPLRADRGFAVDLEAVEELASRGAAALLVVSPGNPTGMRLTRQEAGSLGAIGARHRVPIVCDEVFGDFVWRDDPSRQPTLAGSSRTLTFVLNGLSKMLALPQLKLAWIAVGGPQGEAAEAMHRLEIMADTFLSVGTPVQAALPSLLALRPRLRDEVLRRVKGNRRLLEDRAAAVPSCRCLPAEAGWGSVLQVPRTRSDEQWALDLLERDGVLVHPGYFFDFAEEGHLVLSLLPPEETFARGVDRLLGRVSHEAG